MNLYYKINFRKKICHKIGMILLQLIFLFFQIALALDGFITRDVPIVYIRFNPHACWVDSRLFSHSLTAERLLVTIRGMDTTVKRLGVELI